MKLSSVLKHLREEKGIGQKELAAVLNYSPGTISNYENGIHAPNLATLSALADYYNVTTDYLLGRTDCPHEINLKQHISGSYTVKDLLCLLHRLPESDRKIFVACIKRIECLMDTWLSTTGNGCD